MINLILDPVFFKHIFVYVLAKVHIEVYQVQKLDEHSQWQI